MRSGQSWKADQLFRVKGCNNVSWMWFHVAFVKEMWTLWKTCYREMDLVHCGLYDAKLKASHPKALTQLLSREICTCSMLTVTLLLLYRKFIPLRFLPWCDNLITLVCRRTVVFHCFLKVKNRQVVCSFQVPSRQPLDQIGWNEHVVRTFADKSVSANSDYSSH